MQILDPVDRGPDTRAVGEVQGNGVSDAAGVAAYALDPEAAERLWAVSEQMNQ